MQHWNDGVIFWKVFFVQVHTTTHTCAQGYERGDAASFALHDFLMAGEPFQKYLINQFINWLGKKES